MLIVEDWAKIRRLRRSEGMAIQAIALRLRMSRTVKKALASDEPPRYRRAAKGSIVDAVEAQIRAAARRMQRRCSPTLRYPFRR
ncbi:hypothetical protein GCM10010169_34800 [Micromonospora fulviviridis]|nr:hypothetical protein GCM10010169_34800 [Micromonospora fulviviridis]